MSQILRFALILGLISAVAAGALAYTNQLTAGQIAQQLEKATQAALAEVMPSAASFEPQPEVLAEAQAADPSLASVTGLYRAMGLVDPVGFACSVSVTGYGGPVQLMVGVSDAGVITGVKVISAANETPGLGAKIKDAGFQAQFAGKNGTQPLLLVKNPPAGDSEVQAIAAATISSSAVLRAVNGATAVYRAVSGGGGDRLAKLKEDAVKAMFPAADSVATDPELLEQLKAADPGLADAGGIYYAKQGETVIGLALEGTGQGYAGPITAIVGYGDGGNILSAVFVDLPDETVGLGTKITEAPFTGQFVGKSASRLSVTNAAPGANEIQAVTGATRSSRGAVAAVNAANLLYQAMPGR